MLEVCRHLTWWFIYAHELDVRTVRSNKWRYRIYRCQGGLCALCGDPLGEDYQIDHIESYAKGGRTVSRNLQATHPFCNRSKGSKNVSTKALKVAVNK